MTTKNEMNKIYTIMQKYNGNNFSEILFEVKEISQYVSLYPINGELVVEFHKNIEEDK